MKSNRFLVPLMVLIAATLTLGGQDVQAHAGHHSSDSKAVSTKMAVRDLWVDHIFWVRSVLFATARKDKSSAAEAEKQAVANARNIANVIEPFYGKEAADKLFELLGGHYGAIKEYINATLPSPNAKSQKAATDKLTSNAVEIATFLSGANPNLPKETLVGLLAAHGGHHITQTNQVQKRDYSGEAKTWGAMKTHMYAISDALVGAIAKQFPEKFK